MVTDDPGEADAAVAQGKRVVLIVPAGSDRAARPGLAVFVGDPADPGVRAAAAAMDAELGGTRATPSA
jgi:hypothetical protein